MTEALMPPRYRFLRFAAHEANAIWLDGGRAFLLATPDGAPAIVNGICPHRGGPLALGDYDCATASLRCPWHGQRQTRRQLLARAWPAIRVGDSWVVAVPAEARSAICFRQKSLALKPSAR
jgi:nitrite reductase (NADH) small subunit